MALASAPAALLGHAGAASNQSALRAAMLALATAALFLLPPSRIGASFAALPSAAAPVADATAAQDDELKELARVTSAFGAPSRVSCTGAAERTSCAFSNLYLVAGRLRFLLAAGGGEGEDAASSAGAAAAAVAPFADLALGVPLKVVQRWLDLVPVALTPKELQSALLDAGGTHDTERTPIFLFQRLQPHNVYHHLWDDAATLFALLNDWLPRSLRRHIGTPLSVRFVFADTYGGTVPNQEVWEALSSLTAQPWESFIAERPAGAVIMLSRLYAGAAGRCVHKRHCVASPAPEVLLRFKHHMLKFLGDPTRRSQAATPVVLVQQRPEAVLVIRTGRRRILNSGAVLSLLERLGYNAHAVGPFSGMTLRAQLEAVANSSLVVVAHGAELGPLWLGMREGACASILLPFLFSESFAWWAGAPLGLRLAPYWDAPANKSDERLAFRDSLPPRKPPRQASEFEITVLYHRDFLVDVERLGRTMWCA